MQVNLAVQTYKQEGDLQHSYSPLRNVLNDNNEIVEFDISTIDKWKVDLEHPLNMECQPSYDGTVNLIINDDKNPPRIINTRFSKIEDSRYKIINRNQKEQTNLYKLSKIDAQTRLFRNINTIPKIDLVKIQNTGQLMGGNYTFYIKFADNDYNKTDVVAESGQVSIFKGYVNKVSSISGTVFNERTDKTITLKISNIDTSFSKIYVYYTRETSDTNGIRITKAGMYTKPYDIKDSQMMISFNGFEEETEITPEEINIQYNIVSAAKTQAQVQNMLFFGNVQSEIVDVKNLQNLSYYIEVSLQQKEQSIGYLSTEDYSQPSSNDVDQTEYYNPQNIYYSLGYWPDEIYRLGIVYILNDDSLTPVFNLRGHQFSAINEKNFTYSSLSDSRLSNLFADENTYNYLERDEFLADGSFLDNTFGVFKTPNATIINGNNSWVKPLYFKMHIPDVVFGELSKYNVKGFFFVRQKRIPTNLCQGLSIGVDRISYVPMLYDSSKDKYVAESFLTDSYTLNNNIDSHLIYTDKRQCSGLLCLDAIVNPQLQSSFDGSEFLLKPQYQSKGNLIRDRRHWAYNNTSSPETQKQLHTSLVFVDSNIPAKYVNGFMYSTKCGVAEDVSKFAFFSETNRKSPTKNILRGSFCAFLGANMPLIENMIYTIKVPNYSKALMKDYFLIRSNDKAPFFAISQRYGLDETQAQANIDCYRGDCYTNTVTIRLNKNFIDSEVPTNDIIIDSNTWNDNFKGVLNMVADIPEDDDKKDNIGSYANINRADVNCVQLGMWVTYKCLSNYNLGLRSIDTSYTDEYALMGSPRGFYPFNNMSTVSANKIEESALLNDGYDATVGIRRNFIVDNVPYIKDLYDNRIMFSNVQREDDFQNAYRIFQGLSFKDIDRQYGAIVKLLPYGNNLFCVFEHGLGIVPINEKALIQTATNQSIHMYGAGVIQNQITLISPDFGSIWQESIIRTPVGIYGVDTYAKKIWRYSDKGLETISDMKVQRFLNDNVKLKEQDKYPIIAIKNVKTHFNNYKGDVMFTFYNESQNTNWNLCYNERMNKWITRYSWTPLYSENINNIFYSFDKNRATVLSHIYDNKYCTYGIRTSSNNWNTTETFISTLNSEGYTLPTKYEYDITSIETSYLNSIDQEVKVLIDIDDSQFKYIYDGHNLCYNITLQKLEVTENGHTSYQYGFSYDNQRYNLFEVTYSTEVTKLLKINYNAYNKLFSDILQIDCPIYFNIHFLVNMTIVGENSSLQEQYGVSSFTDVVGIVVDNLVLKNSANSDDRNKYQKQRNYFLQNGFYVHGKAGIFNEIKYRDSSFENEILPTYWYDRQEPFEFEFVVNDEVGLHKIFDNLVIISNNVQPNQIEYEIIGDVYKFNKAGIFRNQTFNEDIWNTTRRSTKPGIIVPQKPIGNMSNINPEDWTTAEYPKQQSKPRINSSTKSYQATQDFYNGRIEWDDVLNQYTLVTTQLCKNIEQFGRRLGNIQYKEDSWYITIDPIMYKERFKTTANGEESEFTGKIKSVRIRDKFVKIRVKYTGEDMVIITALRTILTPSYS